MSGDVRFVRREAYEHVQNFHWTKRTETPVLWLIRSTNRSRGLQATEEMTCHRITKFCMFCPLSLRVLSVFPTCFVRFPYVTYPLTGLTKPVHTKVLTEQRFLLTFIFFSFPCFGFFQILKTT